MRLLGCFSKPPIVLDASAPAPPTSISTTSDRSPRPSTASSSAAGATHPSHPTPTPTSTSASRSRNPAAFVPASIAELHPEYAHSEPYCFAARTESARVLVDRVRGAKGQTVSDRAAALKQQGLVVVRGPTHASTSVPAAVRKDLAGANSPPRNHVPLQVESPTTDDLRFVDSDENHPSSLQHQQTDENADTANLVTSSPTPAVPAKPPRTSAAVSARSSGKLSRKSKKKSLPRSLKSRNRSRALNNSNNNNNAPAAAPPLPPPVAHAPPSPPPSSSPASDHLPLSTRVPSGGLRRRSDAPPPTRTYSSSDAEMDGSLLSGRRTPPALLAPIMVPRMSFEDNGDVRKMYSPALSNDSWALNDCAERFDDVEDDLSSGIVKLSAVGKHRVIHTAAPFAPQHSLHDEEEDDDDDGLLRMDGGDSMTASMTAGARAKSKRKSKPFLLSSPGFDNSAPPAAPDSSYDRFPSNIGGGTLPPATLSRQISAGVISDDIQFVDTSGDDDVYHHAGAAAPSSRTDTHPTVQAEGDLFKIPSRSTAAKRRLQQQHNELLHLPSASAHAPTGIIRRASTANKRKTVSFHDESPVIIEPNLRAPRSLPRESMLAKSPSETSEYKDALEAPRDSFSRLRGVRDSVSLAAHTKAPNKMFASVKPNPSTSTAAPPKTLDIPRPRMQREFSDSSEEPSHVRSSRRMSRVSVRDKEAIRAASKRQSRAVAQAMSEQIRGVPKSAMLAFSENEVLISDDGLDDEDSDLSFRRSARAKSIRVPPRVAPGEVPAPPPPPPFQPQARRARSVRKPPPPPASPIRH